MSRDLGKDQINKGIEGLIICAKPKYRQYQKTWALIWLEANFFGPKFLNKVTMLISFIFLTPYQLSTCVLVQIIVISVCIWHQVMWCYNFGRYIFLHLIKWYSKILVQVLTKIFGMPTVWLGNFWHPPNQTRHATLFLLVSWTLQPYFTSLAPPPSCIGFNHAFVTLY